jgi:CheY-like chemotaxis protein
MLLAIRCKTERRPQPTDIGVEPRLFNPAHGARQVLPPDQPFGLDRPWRDGPQLRDFSGLGRNLSPSSALAVLLGSSWTGAWMNSLGDPEAAPQAVRARILVVEDEPLIRFAIAEALREEGASVIEAATADEAWRYLSGGEPVDLIFTDHRMPGSMTGAQLAVRVRRQYPSVAVVVTSGAFDASEWTEPIKQKPYLLAKTANDLMRLAMPEQKGSAP